MKHQTVQPSIDKRRGTVSHQTYITKHNAVSPLLFAQFFSVWYC